MKNFLVLVALIVMLNGPYAHTDDEEMSALDDNSKVALKRGIPADKEAMQSAAFELASAIATVIGIAAPNVGIVLAVGTSFLKAVVENLQDEAGADAIWDKIEHKVLSTIGKKLAESEIYRMKDEVFFPLQRRISKAEEFQQSDLDDILDLMSRVVPSNRVLAWNYDLPLTMVYYVPFLIAGYHQIIKKEPKRACELGEEMTIYRQMVINGFKEMTRKRYSAIKGITYDTNSYDCSKKHNITKRGRGSNKVCTEKHVTYEDEITKETFTLKKRGNSWHGSTWDDEIKKIKEKVVTFLFEQVAEKINKYFKPNIFFEKLKCKVPPKITKAEISFEWPEECFGDKKCLHPADTFGETYNWCYVAVGAFVEKDSIRDLESVDFETCMPKLHLPVRLTHEV